MREDFLVTKTEIAMLSTLVRDESVNAAGGLRLGGNLEDECDNHERLVRGLVGDDLEDGEVLQHAVHDIHGLELLQLSNEAHHVVAHRRLLQSEVIPARALRLLVVHGE